MSNFKFKNHTLIKYHGNEDIVVILEEHNGIAITAIADNAFGVCNFLATFIWFFATFV